MSRTSPYLETPAYINSEVLDWEPLLDLVGIMHTEPSTFGDSSTNTEELNKSKRYIQKGF